VRSAYVYILIDPVTLAATANGGEAPVLAFRLVVVNPVICKYMLSPPFITATQVSTVRQYIMFEQEDNSIQWLGSSQACV